MIIIVIVINVVIVSVIVVVIVGVIFVLIVIVVMIVTDTSNSPVALAILLKSGFLTLLTAMAPASTKYLRQRSSMPPVVRMTLAPELRIS